MTNEKLIFAYLAQVSSVFPVLFDRECQNSNILRCAWLLLTDRDTHDDVKKIRVYAVFPNVNNIISSSKLLVVLKVAVPNRIHIERLTRNVVDLAESQTDTDINAMEALAPSKGAETSQQCLRIVLQGSPTGQRS